MAHLLRGKQAGVANLSAGLVPDDFYPDVKARHGISSQITAVAYDPVQSLVAVGTRDGQIYVFGKRRIQVTLRLPGRGAAAHLLQFSADKLVCLDSKHDVAVISLESKTVLKSHSAPGIALVLVSDPTLDYAFLGMQTGEILAYDMAREALAPFRIPDLWHDVDPRARAAPVVSLALHPRDIGTLLVGYAHGAVVYSFKQNKALKHFQYQIPPGAPGGDANPATINTMRRPKVVQALWHPTGTFILTAHDDSSLVFWDPKDGRVVMARTTTDTYVDRAGGRPAAQLVLKDPIVKVSWCANQDPDDTAILVAGGSPSASQDKGLTLLELGRTPNYATSTWDVLTSHFDKIQRRHVLHTPPGPDVVDYCLVPRSSPHFAGAHDPIAAIALLNSGELITLTFPSGFPISATNQLHVSMTFVHPFVKCLNLTSMVREKWMGMTETRQQGPAILKGGEEAALPMRRFDDRTIVQTSHADGTVRLWDIGNGDEIENEKVVQIDVGRAVGRVEGIDVTVTSLAGASGEFAAGTRTGEVAVFRWAANRGTKHDAGWGAHNRPGALTNITDRSDPGLREGLCPLTLLDMQSGPITALLVSDVGFVAAASEGGQVAVIDLRGPAVIFNSQLKDLIKPEKHGGLLRRGSSQGQQRPDWMTSLEFSVMTADGDNFSSILLHAGTTQGHLVTFKIVPDPSGRYTVQFVGSTSLDSKVLHISPVNAETGAPAAASQSAVGNLRNGVKVNGVLVVAARSEVRIFRPAAAKGAHKTFDSFFCETAGVVRHLDKGYAFVALCSDGYARAYALPSVKELSSHKIDHILDVRRLSEAVFTPTGNVLGWAGPSETALVSLFGAGGQGTAVANQHLLYNPAALVPPRPTISNFQWVSGTQYTTPADMDVLIGGPDRPPSKRMIAQARSDELQRRQDLSASSSSGARGQQDEGYWAYMQRQMQERTQQLGLMGESMQNLEANSSGWAEDVGNFVSRQKRNMVTGLVKNSLGF